MAELSARERLQPSLLDRLTDDDAASLQEPRDKRVLGMRGLRRAVLRDLGWLFNATGLAALQDLDDYPLTAHSVLNFGFADLSGQTASGLDADAIARRLRQAIWDFEPRVLRDTVQVLVTAGHGNQLVFEVHGQLWGQPLPERLYLKTELDLELGEIRVYDEDARGA
ncbi:type VI secretion system baseplate subunit TssE [Massilia sp. S19_KUP03_FR1]|uniref:type VI secretion system baseplate subunit TssE n=1 Tax=Massilia sp. S19_KUP03_FR1 TaxID=3025503 RepID=UPI002FCD732B